jgi:serine/threonine protein kinase
MRDSISATFGIKLILGTRELYRDSKRFITYENDLLIAPNIDPQFPADYAPLGTIENSSQYLCQHVKSGLLYIVTKDGPAIHSEIAQKLHKQAIDCPFLELAQPLDGGKTIPYLRTGFFQGSLYTWITLHQQPISQRQLLSWMLQLACAVDTLDSVNYVHPNLEPAYVFVTTQNTVKLADYVGPQTLTAYSPPEQQYDPSAHVWGLGLILYELLGGKHVPLQPSFGSASDTEIQNRLNELESVSTSR